MLPDYPKGKEKFKRFLNKLTGIEQKAYLGPFAEIPLHRIFEGPKLIRHILEREDGSKEDMSTYEASSSIRIDLENYEKLSLEDLLNKIRSSAREIAIQRNKMIYEEVEKASKKVGNVIDFKDKPFSAELFLKALEKILISFDLKGNPILPTIVAGKKAYKKINEVLPELDRNPQIKSKFEELINKKRMEWNDREASRKLVG